MLPLTTLSSPSILPSPKTPITKSLMPKTLILKTLTPQTLIPKTLSTKSLNSKPYPLHCSSLSISPIQVADLVENDYSFLDSPSTSSQQSQIIAAAKINEKSKILISFPTLGFVDRLVNSAKCELIVAVHESLFLLAMIKEGNDRVRCFQGGIDVVPEKFAPFDVVFVSYFPGMGVGIGELLASAAKLCSKGARVIISFDQGREIIEQEHKKQYPDIATSDLPDKITLEKATTDHSFQITEFVDEPALYLAVLKFC